MLQQSSYVGYVEIVIQSRVNIDKGYTLNSAVSAAEYHLGTMTGCAEDSIKSFHYKR